MFRNVASEGEQVQIRVAGMHSASRHHVDLFQTAVPVAIPKLLAGAVGARTALPMVLVLGATEPDTREETSYQE